MIQTLHFRIAPAAPHCGAEDESLNQKKSAPRIFALMLGCALFLALISTALLVTLPSDASFVTAAEAAR